MEEENQFPGVPLPSPFPNFEKLFGDFPVAINDLPISGQER
jgi:hypothetical protein